ncbi:MAG: Tim44/TimA family putative adaptor protein [Alphaproteobacteria bacterium]
MPADLLVYAIVAAGLVFWLKSVLGTRHGEERERPAPFSRTIEDIPQEGEEELRAPITPADDIRELSENPTETLGVENKTAEDGLLTIADADKNFEIRFFLAAAQDVFVMVVEAFSKADRETLQDLLAPNVFDAFDGALTEREKSGETLDNEIQAIRKAEVIEAALNGRNAQITVRFVADELSVTRDKEGEIIAGSTERTSEMLDIWTFTRDIKSRDPRWLVSETRGGFEDDNETLPNTD